MDLLPFVHISPALVCGKGTGARGFASWERRGPPRPPCSAMTTENWTRYPPSSASTPSIHALSWRSPLRSPVLAKAVSTTQTPRKNNQNILAQANCFEVLFNLNRHGFPCGTLTESIWEWISARRRLSLSLIGPHCRHSSPGIMRFMNASNKGTVKAVSP